MGRETKTLRKQAFYPYPPEQVWVALTDPRAIAEWLMPNDFKAELGHKFQFQTDSMPGCRHSITDCEVIELDPPRRLAYTWVSHLGRGPNPRPTTVRWTLHAEGGGTRLEFEHVGIEVIPLWARLMMRFGWGTMIKRWIPKVARNVGEDGTFTPGAIPLHKRCYKVKTIDAHMVR